MIELWLLELAKGIGRLFLHPLLYWVIGLTLFASILRIKKERANFGMKIFHVFSEWRGTWVVSLLFGCLLSLLMVGAGVVMPYGLVLLWTIVIVLLSITARLTWLSAGYTLSATFFIMTFMPIERWSFLPADWYNGLAQTSMGFLPIMIGLLLFVEAILLKRHYANESFPQYTSSGRGKVVGQHMARKLAIMPAFVLIPGGAIESFAPWWPLFSIHDQSFGLMLVPFVFGYELVVKGMPPQQATNQLGNYVLLLAISVIGLSIGGLYMPILSVSAVVLALIGRMGSSFAVKWQDSGRNPYFTLKPDGIPVLGVIPYSTADKMGLLVGEQIEQVNNIPVTNEEEFHQAMQTNRAFCKITVRDQNGEIRFTQSAMYEDDYYELGLVFVKDRHNHQQGMNIVQ